MKWLKRPYFCKCWHSSLWLHLLRDLQGSPGIACKRCLMYLLTFPLDLWKLIKQNKSKETKHQGRTAICSSSDVPSDGFPTFPTHSAFFFFSLSPAGFQIICLICLSSFNSNCLIFPTQLNVIYNLLLLLSALSLNKPATSMFLQKCPFSQTDTNCKLQTQCFGYYSLVLRFKLFLLKTENQLLYFARVNLKNLQCYF